MADEPVKRKRGRPPLSPEEKAIRERERKDRRNAKERQERAEKTAARGKVQPAFVQKITEKVVDQFEEVESIDESVKYEDPNLALPPKHPGRAKGSKNKPKTDILSYKSSKKLEALGYDPIERQIEIYSLILTQMAAKDPETGKPLIKVGSMAHATMLGHLRAINNDLAKYAYRPIPEKQEIEHSDKAPTLINLTLNKPKEEEPKEEDKEE